MAEDNLRRHYGRVHSMHVAAFAAHLVECRKLCDGDLDLFLVLTIVGERTFAQRNAPDLSFEEWSSASVSMIKPEAINLQSIADYSGIPRETVRRKLERLIEKGWVTRDARNYVTATDAAKQSLGALTESNLRYLETMRKAFGAIDAA